MADAAKGEITDEQKRLIEEWHKEKGSKAVCPMCQTNSWNLYQHFVTPTIVSPGGGFIFGGTAYPHFMLACANCSNVQFINAVSTGILKKPEEEPKKEEPKT
jgi:hypothetical protein